MSADEQVVDEQAAPVTDSIPVVPPVESITVLDREWDAYTFPIAGYQLAVETAAAATS